MKPTKGDVVKIEFLDHCEDGDDVILFKVYGEVTKITQRAYHVVAWGFVNEVDGAANSYRGNEKTFCIVKKAVQSVVVYRPCKK